MISPKLLQIFGCSRADWVDWRWQLRCRIRSLDKLTRIFPQVHVTDEMRQTAEQYPFAVTPYYLSLAGAADPADPILRQCIPDDAELIERPGLHPDELGEDSTYAPVPGLVHRYPDRVVVITSTVCPAYCRHCTRKRLVGRSAGPTEHMLRRQLAYVRRNPQIKDVILSGGDPLMLSTTKLARIIAGFRSIPSVEIIRIGTRVPVTLPMRIDDKLCSMLERHHPIWVNTQFNHPREVTPEAAAACDRLLRHGIPVNNQAVLLAGVNDSPAVMEELCRALLRIRVRPYYLLQCDPVAGIEHFRTPVRRGLDIMQSLFKNIGGIGVPRFVVDALRGGGKMPITPGYVIEHRNGELTLRNFDGRHVTYPDGGTAPACKTGKRAKGKEGKRTRKGRSKSSPVI